MSNSSSIYNLIIKNIKPVIFRNFITLVNFLFFIVISLLFYFKEYRDALFLSIVFVLNIVIGIFQELRAKIALEKLQLLMTPQAILIDKKGNEVLISIDKICNGDKLKIKLGDQVPADGILIENYGLATNEALITGESRSILKHQNNEILAGNIVTAGFGIIKVITTPKESYISGMTEEIKKYSLNLSPIQKTLSTFIKYMTYLLIATVIYIIIYGLSINDLFVSMVKDIATLTSTLVPQGLILSITIFFAYGALKMFKEQVLLQEINATEKLGRIKNLCIDKTGTLTENTPHLEKIEVFGKEKISYISTLIKEYVRLTEDGTETMRAIVKKVITKKVTAELINLLPFSSQYKYSHATIKINNNKVSVVVGAPDVLLSYINTKEKRDWLQNKINFYTPKAKRLVLIARTQKPILHSKKLSKESIEPLGLFVLDNPLRHGTKNIINFFQKRGVNIRVISGDNPETVRVIACEAGIKNTELIITGPEIKKWSNEKLEKKIENCNIFARITPDQKEKIVEILKTKGFTAMVGDGANDALAIKKSDLGIAMFNGAGATRQIAQIVLMNNSFAALPIGVNMAETIITNIELVTSIFLNKVMIGFLLFVGVSFLGFTYPMSPRNITIINVCTVFIPFLYWGLFPAHKEGANPQQLFFKKILPFCAINSIFIALASIITFALSPVNSKIDGSNSYVVIVIIALGYWFFMLAPKAYGASSDKKEKKALYLFAFIIIIFLLFVMYNAPLSHFFDIKPLEPVKALGMIGIIIFFGLMQYIIMRKWFDYNKYKNNVKVKLYK